MKKQKYTYRLLLVALIVSTFLTGCYMPPPGVGVYPAPIGVRVYVPVPLWHAPYSAGPYFIGPPALPPPGPYRGYPPRRPYR